MMRLPPLNAHRKDVKVWVDEAIWGHRFYNDQTPWLVMLEFLNVFRSVHQQDPALALNQRPTAGQHEKIKYQIPRLLPLRKLIFNNPQLQTIEDKYSSDAECWQHWLKEFDDADDFSYLQDRLTEFRRLVRIVELFQNATIEAHRQRRWTSRFIFPHGPNCLYADLKSEMVGADRRFFARGGELLYLMLSRSGQGSQIAQKISAKLMNTSDTWDRVAKALLPPDYVASYVEPGTFAYLPFAERPEYEALGQTWLRILDLGLPGATLLGPLMRLSALDMLLYMLRRAREEVGEYSDPYIVLEVAAPNRTTLFELSSENFGKNRMLSRRAVRAYVNHARCDPAWQAALEARVPAQAAMEHLAERFAWKAESEHLSGDPESILKDLLNNAEERHLGHVYKVHQEWSRQIGLSVSRRGAGTWYSPNDAMLKALVIGTVDDGRQEFHHFLAKLFERYRLVIGVAEAEQAFGYLPTDQNAFLQNTQRLEERLRTLGLLRRLSDDCAFVENRFGRRS